MIDTVAKKTYLIQPARTFAFSDIHAIWGYRELLYLLIWRDVRVRYKQTVIGVGWAVFQPVMTMLIFVMVFSMFAKVPSDGVPYPLFAYSALLPWNYFSQAITRGGHSLTGEAHLISKIYFPRLIVPLSAILAPLVDFACALIVLVLMMIWYGVSPTWRVMILPVYLLLAVTTALAVGLWLAALNVRYRDVGHTISLLTQVWLFTSPIAYPISVVPATWRFLYSLNPMVSVIAGFRWALLAHESPALGPLVASLLLVLALLLTAVVYFSHVERTFVDIV